MHVVYQQPFDNSFGIDLLVIEFQSFSFEEVEYLLKALLVGEAVVICTYMDVSECKVNSLPGASEYFSSLKLT